LLFKGSSFFTVSGGTSVICKPISGFIISLISILVEEEEKEEEEEIVDDLKAFSLKASVLLAFNFICFSDD
jgi:hypothetical protein